MSAMCLVWYEELYVDFLTWSSSSHSSEINTIIFLVRTLQCRFGYMLFQPMNLKLFLPFCLSDSVSLSLFKSNNSIGDTLTLMVRGPHSTFDGSWTYHSNPMQLMACLQLCWGKSGSTSPRPCQASAPSLLCLLHTWLQKAAVSSSSQFPDPSTTSLMSATVCFAVQTPQGSNENDCSTLLLLVE